MWALLMTLALQLASSTPTFSAFDPSVIPYQDQVVDDVLCQYDYGLGVHELLLSGAVGSAKSVLMAHLGIRHCLEFPRARLLLGRKALPDLKKTIFTKVLEHLEGSLKEGRDYTVSRASPYIRFRNGSEVIVTTWADKRYKKVRSLDISAAIIEELTENNDEDKEAYFEILMRIGRLPHVPQGWLCAATNPDGPSHWVYDHFELGKDESLATKGSALGLGPNQDRAPTKHVYYSVTDDNPFLPDSYKERLRTGLDPKRYMRMGKGRWIELKSDGIYYAYDKARNYRDVDYVINASYPVILAWDFNIGDGKPLSAAVMQFIRDELHIFGEVVVDGIRTEESCEEMAARGFLDHPTSYVVCGDASGKHRDTRSKRSDYEIIKSFLANYRTPDGRALRFETNVPLANPPVRTRHNVMNAYCANAAGVHRLFGYRGAPTVDKALRLTALKPGGQYIEDDSKPYQHIGTAVGYALVALTKNANSKPQGMVQL